MNESPIISLAEQGAIVEEYLVDRRRLAAAGSVTAAREVVSAERDLRSIRTAEMMAPIDAVVDALRPAIIHGDYEEPREALFSLAVSAVEAYIAAGGTDLDCTLQAIAENLE